MLFIHFHSFHFMTLSMGFVLAFSSKSSWSWWWYSCSNVSPGCTVCRFVKNYTWKYLTAFFVDGSTIWCVRVFFSPFFFLAPAIFFFFHFLLFALVFFASFEWFCTSFNALTVFAFKWYTFARIFLICVCVCAVQFAHGYRLTYR